MQTQTGKRKESADLRDRIIQRLMIASQQYPVTYDALAEEFFPDVKRSSGWRRVTKLLEALWENGYPVATTNQEPAGCWMARNQAEMVDTAKRLQDQARAIFHHAKKLSENIKNDEWTIFDSAMADPQFEKELKEDLF